MSDTENMGTWNSRLTRRGFFRSAGIAATVATTGLGSAVRGQEASPRLDPTDATAQALNYAHDAATVDPALRSAGRFCHGCVLYQGGGDDDWAACSIFPGKQVAGKGWCAAWAPKPGQ